MMCVRQASVVLLTFLFCVQSLAAQQTHVADVQALNKALAVHRAAEDADRQMVLGVLERPEVRQQAERMGLSPERARAAVASMTAADLQQAVNQAKRVEGALTGGASTVTLQATTIIIILLVVILLIVAID